MKRGYNLLAEAGQSIDSDFLLFEQLWSLQVLQRSNTYYEELVQVY